MRQKFGLYSEKVIGPELQVETQSITKFDCLQYCRNNGEIKSTTWLRFVLLFVCECILSCKLLLVCDVLTFPCKQEPCLILVMGQNVPRLRGLCQVMGGAFPRSMCQGASFGQNWDDDVWCLAGWLDEETASGSSLMFFGGHCKYSTDDGIKRPQNAMVIAGHLTFCRFWVVITQMYMQLQSFFFFLNLVYCCNAGKRRISLIGNILIWLPLIT